MVPAEPKCMLHPANTGVGHADCLLAISLSVACIHCRFANQGLNTFLFAMMSLELKHRAPKVYTSPPDAATEWQ